VPEKVSPRLNSEIHVRISILGRNIFEPPRFMSCSQAAQQLMVIAQKRKNAEKDESSLNLNESTCCVAVARVGADDQALVTTTLGELSKESIDMGKPLHSLVIPGKMHYLEEEAIKVHKL